MRIAAALLLAGLGLLPACEAKEERIVRSHPVAGVKAVVLRSALAKDAEVVSDRDAKAISVSGRPSGGAPGYHPAQPGWKETPASDWGLDFVFQRHGDTLVVSSKNEIRYIHHSYLIREIRVSVPANVTVTREERTLSGTGAEDLSPPKDH